MKVILPAPRIMVLALYVLQCTVPVAHDVRFGFVEVKLVLYVADDLFEDILDGDQPGDTAVLIDHDGDVIAVAAKILEQHV